MAWPRGNRTSKYRNRKTTIHGLTFDSAAEAAVYCTLRMRAMRGEIVQLERQVRFPLIVNGDVVATWIADFTYVDRHSGEFHAVDVKSSFTRTLREYRTKRKLVRACYGFDIEEVTGQERIVA